MERKKKENPNRRTCQDNFAAQFATLSPCLQQVTDILVACTEEVSFFHLPLV